MAYATTAELAQVGLPAAALANVTTAVQQKHLDTTAGRMDTYLRAQHSLPFGTIPQELVECNAVMAGYTLLQNFRGYAPEDVDDGFRARYLDCIAWLKELASGAASLDQTIDASPDINEGRPRVQTGGANRAHGTGDTGEARGW